MANPHFGIWPAEDDAAEFDPFGTVPSAEDEFLKNTELEPHGGECEESAPGRLERLMARVAAVEDLLYGRKDEDHPAELVHGRLSLKVKPFAASPASFPPGDPHSRPFTLEEAARVLKKLGIWNAVPLRTYLSGTPHQDYGEPLGRCQVVEARVAGREVHFYLRYCRRGKRGGWRVAGAFAASDFCPKTDWEEALGKAPRPEKFDFAANGLTPGARVRVKFDTTVTAHSVTEITGKVEGIYPDFAVIRSSGGVPVTVHRTDIACGFAKISRM
ncbi:hypothetical protein G7K71_13490 [Desulfofundulus sp. TPOSR]|uniref:hypothetical protein n=1 Tax=Desulfofundulus sp. TPOSR TaxID=2714340 RepID=UPI00140D6FC6|nr:hypothetical protein [Desulfofundulus sp. TPOSR]NHM27971.1 hypothetical protein [Desulfofundulus sp. TPOSR]